MIAAMVVAMAVMLAAAGTIGEFVEDHPTMKMLALSFLILIGVMLLAEGMGQHISKGYIYFAMAFSFAVEMLNLRLRKNLHPPVAKLGEQPAKQAAAPSAPGEEPAASSGH
jgi:predicted tellurium resistance membrane protein TerC